MNEITLNADLFPAEIKANFDDVQNALKKELEVYEATVVTLETKKEAKDDLASLRKLRKNIDDRRKEIKKEHMKPYNEFEDNVKKLIATIDVPINAINEQLGSLEDQRKQEKEQKCRELYEECVEEEFKEYLPYDEVARKQWLNATYSEKDIRFDISEELTNVKQHISLIKALTSPIEDKLLNIYKDSGDPEKSIKAHQDYIEYEKRAREVVAAESKAVEEANFAETEPDTDKATFIVYGEDIEKVEQFLSFAGIKYRRA